MALPSEVRRLGGSDANFSYALWKSDGTPGGTVEIPLPAEPGLWPAGLTACNGRLFFQNSGMEPGFWTSDGTAEGTVKLARLRFSGDAYEPRNRPLCKDGTLFFMASRDGYWPSELWKSDGTLKGTVRLGEVGNPFIYLKASPFAAVGSRVFLSTENGLWTSDGTPEGTMRLGDASQLTGLTAAGTAIYFMATDSTYTLKLWTSDGTESGTRTVSEEPLIFDFKPMALGNTLLFSSGNELYRNDGTSQGNVLVKQGLALNNDSHDPSPAALLPDGRWLIAGTENYAPQATLWVSDGSETGTVPLLTSISRTDSCS